MTPSNKFVLHCLSDDSNVGYVLLVGTKSERAASTSFVAHLNGSIMHIRALRDTHFSVWSYAL
jgi:hypothetical protein